MIACPQRLSLVRDWARATRLYAETVTEYSDRAAIDEHADRWLAREAADAAERSRVALARHVSGHGCERLVQILY
jgi:hypothetical protein